MVEAAADACFQTSGASGIALVTQLESLASCLFSVLITEWLSVLGVSKLESLSTLTQVGKWMCGISRHISFSPQRGRGLSHSFAPAAWTL